MRWLPGVACVTVVVLEMAVILGPPAEPSPPKGGRLPALREELRAREPDIVLIGNSLLLDSTDADVFTELTGRKALLIGCSGAASAWWYLALKNVLLDPHARWISGEKPRSRLVVIFFRDYALTDPGFRVTGEYQSGIDALSTAKEPALEALAYRRAMSPLTYFLFRHCPLYQCRQVVRQELNSRLREDVVPFLTGIAGGAEAALERVFAEGNLEAELLTMRQLAAASRPVETAGDFERQLERSFLPHLLGLAQEKGVRLAFVRMKRRRDTRPNREPPALQRYIRDLETYLTESQAPFIDLTHEPGITLDLYGPGDHLRRTPAVRRWFTGLLARRLAPVLVTSTSRQP